MALFKISRKKYRNTIIWFIVFVVFFVTFINAKLMKSVVEFEDFNIEIDTNINNFIGKQEVNQIFSDNGITIIGKKLNEINSDSIETILRNIPVIAEVEVVKSVLGNLEIQIKQVEPIVRLINKSNRSIYVDEEGLFINSKLKKPAHVPIIIGNFKTDFKDLAGKHVHQSGSELITDSYTMACFINNNKFWKNQVEHLSVNKTGEFTIIPRIGMQAIVFGKAKNIDKKFDRLYKLYKNAFTSMGWNNYDTINLAFENQVICKPSLKN